jgi:2-dehydro-3-deoxygalactonokinase
VKPSYIIAGDWGTSTLRLYLLNIADLDGACLVESKSGLGVAQLESKSSDRFESVFFDLAQDWLSRYSVAKVVLSGMIGSSIGWHEAPYSRCPSGFLSHMQSALHFEARGLSFAILGGFSTTNSLGLADTMRGEETQLLGLLAEQDDNSNAARLVALPGTHNKWALLEGNKVSNFMTGFTGELFAVLREHTILLGSNQQLNFETNDFEHGVNAARASSAGLVHTLFSVRARQLVDGETSESSLAYMLGLIIGEDIRGALEMFSTPLSKHSFPNGIEGVTVIADKELEQTYQRALLCFGVRADQAGAETIAVKAFSQLAQHLL